METGWWLIGFAVWTTGLQEQGIVSYSLEIVVFSLTKITQWPNYASQGHRIH